MTLVPGDPLAHRALESLLVAEANVRRRLSLDLEREGLSSTGLLRARRAGDRGRRARAAHAAPPAADVEGERDGGRRHARRARPRVAAPARERPPRRRRVAACPRAARSSIASSRSTPSASARAFAVLDEDEKRQLASICRKLAPARPPPDRTLRQCGPHVPHSPPGRSQRVVSRSRAGDPRALARA